MIVGRDIPAVKLNVSTVNVLKNKWNVFIFDESDVKPAVFLHSGKVQFQEQSKRKKSTITHVHKTRMALQYLKAFGRYVAFTLKPTKLLIDKFSGICF